MRGCFKHSLRFYISFSLNELRILLLLLLFLLLLLLLLLLLTMWLYD